MKFKRVDCIAGLFFVLATIAIITVFFTNKTFFEWAFTRHQNTLSWYIRLLFIIPIVIGAYKKSYSVIFASVFSLFTSMFWFPVPATADERITGFLNFEKEYLAHIKYYCLVMSESYIRNHFSDIKKYASIIENRMDDEWCTLESVLKENAKVLELARKHNVNYFLIDGEYEIDL